MICIDAGHADKEYGAVFDNIEEDIINWEIGRRVYEKLVFAGQRAVLTRKHLWDKPSLVMRAKIANTSKANVFVSIHCNAYWDDQVYGIETIHFKDSQNGKRLAGMIQKAVILETGGHDRGIFERSDLTVLKKTAMTAVIVECGFLSNHHENTALMMASYQNDIAVGITKGILDFIGD